MEEQIQSTEAPQVEQQVEQPQVETQSESQESSPGIQFFDNVEDLAASFGEQPQEEAVAPEITPEPQQVQEPMQVDPEPATTQQPDFTDQDAEQMVLKYMSERLGREFNSFEDFTQPEVQQQQLDERVDAIARFVSETGRSPEDWFAYQRLNPSEMDDFNAVRIHMATEYNNLTADEVGTLMQGKYKLNPDIYSEEEVKMAQLQLKIDAQNAKEAIGRMRDSYKLPAQEQRSTEDVDPIITDEWIANMSKEVDSLSGLEFDLGNGKNWTFGLNDQYKSTLKEKNAKLDEFFDPYVREDGSWDYDTLSSHRAVLDNIDHIVSSIYKQGLSDGQRGVVTTAANVSTKSPVQSQAPTSNPLSEQLRNIMGSGNTMTFNI